MAATASTAPVPAATAQPMVTPGPDLYTYSADLKSSNEIPAIADADAACADEATFILAHIHEGAATVNGPVKIDTGLVASAPIAFGAGAHIQKASVTVDAQTAQSLVTNSGGYYVNVHTAAHGGGVIRGQLVATR